MHSEYKEFKATFIAKLFFYVFAYGWIAFYLYICLFRDSKLIHKNSQNIGHLFFETVLFFVTTLMSNYCAVEKNILILKNYISFWKHKEYDLTKISSIEYLSMPKLGFGLKIKIRNSSSSFHCLNGLSNSSFIELYHTFKQYNIKLTGFTKLNKELI
jgi:hypothetical protein